MLAAFSILGATKFFRARQNIVRLVLTELERL
jgi:hypothetical protein